MLIKVSVAAAAVSVRGGLPAMASATPATTTDPEPDTQDHLHGRSVHGRGA